MDMTQWQGEYRLHDRGWRRVLGDLRVLAPVQHGAASSGPLQQGLGTVANAVVKYGPTCVVGATQGALVSAGTGAVFGCAGAVAVKKYSAKDGPVDRFARAAGVGMDVVDIRRAAYKGLGIPTYREIWKMYRGGPVPIRGGR